MKCFINKNAKYNLVFIPGGPGLSSISFTPLEELKEEFGLYFFDPMGTRTPLKTTPTYEALLSELKESITDIENVILCGHSFGGIQAIDLASQDIPNIKGVIAIGSPVSSHAFEIIGKNFDVELNEDQKRLADLLANDPTDEIYKEWMIAYKDFYFNPTTSNMGVEAIRQDSLCVRSYKEAISESTTKEDKLRSLKDKSILKLYISGSEEKILPPDSAKHEADLGGFDLEIINNGGHFVHYEYPQETMNIIRNYLNQ
ncbi:MAG: alpha/beta hydrolase [Bdellovibrionota bacterium]|nr:alpha/beta hydrolase [Bdellovibrionota bacterium]